MTNSLKRFLSYHFRRFKNSEQYQLSAEELKDLIREILEDYETLQSKKAEVKEKTEKK